MLKKVGWKPWQVEMILGKGEKVTQKDTVHFWFANVIACLGFLAVFTENPRMEATKKLSESYTFLWKGQLEVLQIQKDTEKVTKIGGS